MELIRKIEGDAYCFLLMLNLILDGQEKINERIDELHEKVNSKISRQELSGWVVAVSALVVLVNTVAM